MHILFIGNSHTFCNGLPFQIRQLLRISHPQVEVVMVASGGVTLGWHAQNPETQMAIKYQAWDFIILQQKTHPFDGYRALQQDCGSLLPFLRRTSARVLLYMTWAEKRLPSNQARLERAFTRAARENNFGLAPVSKAWQALLHEENPLSLYDTDGEHANPAGSYLAACVFYAVISGASPLGLPGRIEINGEVLVDLSPEQAGRVQAAAWTAVQNMQTV
jgi:hypothetical protein